MTIKVLDGGLLTTVQDLGRRGYQKDGVPVGGAMDPWSLRLANLLVGNPEGQAGLEMTLVGPTLCFENDTLISLTGANLSPSINEYPVPMFRPVLVKSGSVLRFRSASIGCRGYIGIAGGINVPVIMGSQSTYLPAGLGQALARNDIIQVGKPSISIEERLTQLKASGSFHFPQWAISTSVMPNYAKEWILHILSGLENKWFSNETLENLFSKPFKITPQSNRMGYRLDGPELKLEKPLDMLSTPVMAGTIQVPADGKPIILMADCQTTGGYPRIGHVIQADRRLLAQAKPGDTVLFKPITLAAAHERFFEQEKTLNTIKQAIKMRWKYGTN